MRSRSSLEPVPNARHRIGHVDDIEWITVGARKNWLMLPFLCVWLTLWTFGGIAALTALVSGAAGERLFLGLWLVGWACGWAFAASLILWQAGGRVMVGVDHGVLVHAWRMPLFHGQKSYDVAQIRNLRAGDTSGLFGWARSMKDAPPFWPGVTSGSVRFDYGAATVQLFPGLDEAEGRMIVARLAARLPGAAAGTPG